MAERLSYALSERLGKEKISSHHGSLSKEMRLEAERRLKEGRLKAIVATASLELGIDVGYVDLVCQIGSARSIAATLQRIGRSGHSLGAEPKGRIFALTRDDLLESLATVRAIRRGTLDSASPPRQPLDILAQQIVAAAAADEWREDDLYALVRRAWPYRDLARAEFDEVVAMASQPFGGLRPPVHLHRDQIHGRLRAPRGARMIATSCGGAIPDNADFRVVTTDGGVVGGVNEDFAIESLPGDVFLLGTTSWRIVQVRGSDVVVEDAHGAAPSIPFWIGEAPGRTMELSREVGALREEIAARIPDDDPADVRRAAEWLAAETSASQAAVDQAVRYVAAQKAALGVVPTDRTVVFERFFDETGGMQLVIHAPFGSRVNRGWGLAMRKRFCRSFDFELQASADDNGIVLSLGPQHSVPLEDLFSIVHSRNARHMLEQAALDSPLFRIRWRWNATRSLLVLRRRGGKRVPPALQRFRADDALTAIFPASTACLENRPADVEIPDHPMVRQTMHDCLHEAADLDAWTSILSRIENGEIRLEARETTEPSPFAHERLNAMPYAFLDDAPLEERRARAVQFRRSVPIEEVGDLARLDPEVVAEVREQAWPRARTPDEFHELLLQMQALREEEVRSSDAGSDWTALLHALIAAGRATVATTAGGARFGVAAERWPHFRAAFPSATCEPIVALPARLDVAVAPQDARVAVVRGRIEVAGPTTVGRLGEILDMPPEQVEAALVRLEVEGAVLRGRFDPALEGLQWCDRRLLARIHRRTLDGARRRVKPVAAADFLRFALDHQGVGVAAGFSDREGPGGLFEVVAQLAGIEAPAGAWEHDIFPARVRDYDPAWLDELTFTGAAGWGRLAPPTAAGDRKRLAGLNRAVPISIFPRESLAWLLPPNRVSAEDQARSGAQDVWTTLRDKGALFLADLLAATGLLPSQLDEALGELAALGLVTADGFAGIRALATPVRSQVRVGRRRRSLRGRSAAMGRSISGRWSVFPAVATPTPADRVERWARLLLSRYGVVFRDLLERESVAPPWWELVRVYRLMEARGEVHGGRFVQGVGYEQYALPGAVEALRRTSDAGPSGAWVVLSAADPLNLTGILDRGPRVPATRGNSLAIRDGQVVARCIGGETSWDADLDAGAREEVARKLLAGGPSRWRNRAPGRKAPPVLRGANATPARGRESGLLF
jgi:ATP-dependent Lhr-like helicase